MLIQLNFKSGKPVCLQVVVKSAAASGVAKSRRSSAFTLLELLIVIFIVALLIALLLPALSRSKQKAQQDKCISNLHQLGTALQSFVAENQAYPGVLGSKDAGSFLDRIWIGQLAHEGLSFTPGTTNLPAGSLFSCPSDHSTSNYNLSYGYNAWGIRASGTNDGFGLMGRFVSHAQHAPFSPAQRAPLSESEVVSPSEMMAIGDDFGGAIYLPPRVPSEGGQYPLENVHFRFMFERHQGKLDVVFCDGHVESPTVGFLYTNTTDAALSRWNRDHLPHRDLLQ